MYGIELLKTFASDVRMSQHAAMQDALNVQTDYFSNYELACSMDALGSAEKQQTALLIMTVLPAACCNTTSCICFTLCNCIHNVVWQHLIYDSAIIIEYMTMIDAVGFGRPACALSAGRED